ncbi:CubicO group peptidase (beta-lactamase class C family) [Bacillus pakistanensis]|uniref:CubicO group peptidase (Beta-lactamase class C family) n=2 Tax=Rossellomorea pakistanensis TaxID=992288 RepID=A0ABS2N6L7_9BACI|nr:CubicO group peptidase (beta-lactamase class C family) [Bacillus pakistanensis]
MVVAIQNGFEKFERLYSYVKQAQTEFGSSAASVVVIQDDKIVTEWYEGNHHFKKGARKVAEDSLFNIYSTRKTYICTALAIAIVENKVPIDTAVHEMIDNIPEDVLGEITIRDLCMATGAKFFGASRMEREELQGKIIQKITGSSITQLISEKILKPLKWVNTEWVTTPKENLVCDFQAADGYASVRIESNDGHERNLYTSSRDLAFWGNFHLKKGKINGVQIIPREVFDLMEGMRLQDPKRRILGWYHQDDWYYATGAAGCHCVVFPKHNAVGVRMLNHYTDHYQEDQLAFNSLLLDSLKDNRSEQIPSNRLEIRS